MGLCVAEGSGGACLTGKQGISFKMACEKKVRAMKFAGRCGLVVWKRWEIQRDKRSSKKGYLWRVRFFFLPLRVVLLEHPKAFELVEKIVLSVFAFWTTVSLQDAFSAPLAHPQKCQFWVRSCILGAPSWGLLGVLTFEKRPGVHKIVCP